MLRHFSLGFPKHFCEDDLPALGCQMGPVIDQSLTVDDGSSTSAIRLVTQSATAQHCLGLPPPQKGPGPQRNTVLRLCLRKRRSYPIPPVVSVVEAVDARKCDLR